MPKTVAIRCNTVRYGNKTFGAGVCVVYVFGGSVEVVTAVAGNDRYASLAGDAMLWLIKRGLPVKEARELIAEAQSV